MNIKIVTIVFFVLFLFGISKTSAGAISYNCGQIMPNGNVLPDICGCSSANNSPSGYCCGYVYLNSAGTYCNAGTQEIVACGGSYPQEAANMLCSTACGNAGQYQDVTRGNEWRFCCGYLNINRSQCFATRPREVLCGGGYTASENAFCGDPCFPNGTYSEGGIQKTCCGYVRNGTCHAESRETVSCGGTYVNDRTDAVCASGCSAVDLPNSGMKCCGVVVNGQCQASAPGSGGSGSGGSGAGGGAGAQTGVTSESLDSLNMTIFEGASGVGDLTTPRGIISALLPVLFILGGMILFVMIVWGGFEMLTGAANPKSQEAGKQRITAAVIGFILLFASFWLAQLLELIFGISIL